MEGHFFCGRRGRERPARVRGSRKNKKKEEREQQVVGGRSTVCAPPQVRSKSLFGMLGIFPSILVCWQKLRQGEEFMTFSYACIPIRP